MQDLYVLVNLSPVGFFIFLYLVLSVTSTFTSSKRLYCCIPLCFCVWNCLSCACKTICVWKDVECLCNLEGSSSGGRLRRTTSLCPQHPATMSASSREPPPKKWKIPFILCVSLVELSLCNEKPPKTSLANKRFMITLCILLFPLQI